MAENAIQGQSGFLDFSGAKLRILAEVVTRVKSFDAQIGAPCRARAEYAYRHRHDP
jgi:hypothetical protein